MIISASRRTDIPAYYSQWMADRVREKYVCVRNPMNYNQVSRVDLSPDAVDCIVFWTKNPKPLIDTDLLNEFNDYAYYFQFSLNPYSKDIEINLPDKCDLIDAFKKLSDKITPEKIIWRYDPVLINDKYTLQYHFDNFAALAFALKGYTEKIIFSFMDFYKKISKNIESLNIKPMTEEEKNIVAANFSQVAKENNFLIETCAEDIDLSKYGIGHARCIDAELISKITGRDFQVKRDKNQRPECGCVKSVDIGSYNSCRNGCLYCYANYSRAISP